MVREGKRGFLGFGSEESIVRVTARAGAPPVGGRGGGGRGPRGGGGGGGGGRGPGGRGGSGQSSAQSIARNNEEERQRLEGAARARAEANEDNDDDAPPRRDDDDAAPVARGGYSTRPPMSRDGGRGPRDGGRGGRGGGGGERGGGRGRGFDRDRMRGGGTITLPVRIPGAPDEGPVAPILESEDEVDLAGHTLRDLLTLLGLNETAITVREPETPGDGAGLMAQVFDIVGTDDATSEELGALIGRRGETLQSLQYLLNVIVSSRYDGEQIFAVDIERYRQRREQALVELARRVAAEVRESGDVITLEPMSPAERRIIHLTLQEEDGVATASVGEGQDRQVEVMPA